MLTKTRTMAALAFCMLALVAARAIGTAALLTRPILRLTNVARQVAEGNIGAKAEVHRIISQLAAQGMAIVLISSELLEVLGMADRIVVLHEGRVAAEFDRDEASQERIMAAATGQAEA